MKQLVACSNKQQLPRKEYRAELARQKQAAADALSEAIARLTREKGDLEEALTAKLESVGGDKLNWPRKLSVYKANYKPMTDKVMKQLMACSNEQQLPLKNTALN